MSNKKQNSIDWLVEQLEGQGFLNDLDILQAKAMHKEEHSKTWDKSMDNLDVRGGNIVRAWDDFDDYYTKTFGGQDNVLGVAINEAEEALSQFAVSGRSEQSSLIHHCGNELTEKEIFHDHCLKCSEYISED